MAEAIARTESVLTCRICLENLKDGRRLACDHCFCRTCLEDNQKLNCHGRLLTCPLCRRTTELDNENVDGLPNLDEKICTKQTTHFVDRNWYDDLDDFGLDRLFESAPACTMCLDAAGTDETGGTIARAVSFCRDCQEYMCESCLSSHKRLSKVFSGHSVLSFEDALSDRSPMGADTCSEHKTDRKSFFCEDCKALVCQKCIIARHNIRRHSIRDRADVELEIRENIDTLMMRANQKKEDIQEYIRNIETKRRSIKGIIDKVLFDITEAHRIAMECLGERKTMLIERVRRVEHEHNEKIDEMKENARRKSVRLSQMCEVLERDRYGGLEGETLQSHNRLCQETETQLAENRETEGTKRNLARLQRSAEKIRFVRVDERNVLGHVVTTTPEEEQPVDLQINKLVQILDDDFDEKQSPRKRDQANTSVNNGKDENPSTFSRTYMNDIPPTKMVKSPPVFWSRMPWSLVKESKFPYSEPTCMAVLTPESVVVGYSNNPVITISLNTKESTDFFPNYSAKATCISFLESGGIVILNRDGRITMYNSAGIPTGVRFLTTDTPRYFDTDQNDIFMLTRSNSISVYSSMGGRPVRTLTTSVCPSNIHMGSRCCVVQSKSEIAVISSLDGSHIWSLEKGDRRDHIAVDKESNILYVASPQQATECLRILLRIFNLQDGSKIDSYVLNVAAGPMLAMKVMSPDMIAILTSRTLYIFKKDG